MIIALSILSLILLFLCIYQFVLMKKRSKITTWVSNIIRRPNPFDRVLSRAYYLSNDSDTCTVSVEFNNDCQLIPSDVFRVAIHDILFSYPFTQTVIFENLPNQKYKSGAFLNAFFRNLDFSQTSFDDCEHFGIPFLTSEFNCVRLVMPHDTPAVDFSQYDNLLEELVLPGQYAPAVNIPDNLIQIPREFTIYVPTKHIMKYTLSKNWLSLKFCHPPEVDPVRVNVMPLSAVDDKFVR